MLLAPLTHSRVSSGSYSSRHLPNNTKKHMAPSRAASAAPTPALHDERALLAAYETRPTRPKRSSSERSKEFRAKRKKYEGELQGVVDAMRREVAELTMRRNICQEKVSHKRDHISGSLVKLVREYYLVFQHGLALSSGSLEHPKTKYQLDFLRHAMDPNVQVGDQFGIPALVEQWRLYTMAHASLFVEVGDDTTIGPDDDLVVLLHSKVHVQYSRATFEIMFPGALDDDELISKFMDKQVTYDCTTYFRFTAEGRICFYDHGLGLVDGLLRAAERLDDVLKLMRHCVCKVPREKHQQEAQVKMEVTEPTVYPTNENEMNYSVKAETPCSRRGIDCSGDDRRKLSMNFLLS